MFATSCLLAGIPLAAEADVSERVVESAGQSGPERDSGLLPGGALGDHSLGRAATRSVTCRHARKGTWFYLHRVNHHRARRGEASLSLRRPIRKSSCSYERWRSREWRSRARAERRSTERWELRKRNSIPVGETQLRAYINDDCLEEIVDRETAGTWNPTVYNYSGSGAYGLPQALPGWKMASAGPDWRTNPKTQIRWMRGYVNARYGGSCGALAHHNANGWY